MNTQLFIRRPITTTLIMAAILIFGAFAYRLLPVSDLPNVDFPTISVTASLPGASPETMAAAVALPLEKQFSTIAGLDSMSSTNALGGTSITLQFTLDRNIDAAAQDVQASIAKTVSQLPPELPSPPSYQKVNPADQPIIYLVLSSPTMKLSDVDEYAETTVAQRISTVSGVAQVQVFGAQKYAVRAQLDPRKLAIHQIGIDEVGTAIQNANVNLPTGTLFGHSTAYTVQATGQLLNAAQYRPMIVAYRNGSPVRLSEVGDVYDSVENDKTASWYNGNRSIVLPILRQPGTNTVEVVDSIKQLLPTFREQMPKSVGLDILYDRSVSIRNSVDDVKFTLGITIALVVLVIFLFLRNISATIIPSLALPMSIVGTFAFMYVLGYSVDNLSLMALTLSVGFVVDDAIVMLENIVRHMEMGKRPYQAAVEGAKEIGFTIISITLSLAAVFIPVLFMGGLVGRLLHEFAVTIGAAILVSGFVSLTLTPMLGSRFLRPPSHQHGLLYRKSEAVFQGMLNSYDWSLKKVMAHPLATLMVSFMVLIATGWLYVKIPKGFLPNEDQGQIFAFTEGKQGISFEDMVRHQQVIADVISKNPYVASYTSTVGGGGVNSSLNTGRVFARLKPRNQRPHVEQIIEELRPQISQIPGIRAFLQVPPPIRIGGQLSKSQYQYTLQGPDTDQLYHVAPILEQKARTLPGFIDVTTDLQVKNPEVTVQIDRDKAAALNVDPRQLETALFSAYGSRQISTIYAPDNQYKVIMELKPEFQLDPSALAMLYIHSKTGQLVPLGSVASFNREVGPLTVNHLGQQPAVTLSFNLDPRVSIGQAIDSLNQAAAEILPPTISHTLQGSAQAFESSFKGLGLLLIMAILVIYIVLGILYESFIHPITILSGLPSAGVGALLTLMLFKVELSIYAFVGVIMLVGLVKKNAIMMIDFALDAQREDGKSAKDAIYQGALVRFRPIMMTTMAALMGTLPIAMGFGSGAESRRPLGLAVVGGLVFSQTLTLYITPVYYVYLDRLQQGFKNLFGRKKDVEVVGMETAR
ncbi:MAG TPA: efflux RND transporter permease subunit [Candidatus Saccharimonadales bacterium]|jgi:HAE1 family hydrophobic/amphiphilic exporter-1|nr:efflux RND transporter permease subunit [Candidatus Saccharimonadales bacterium]